MNRDQYQQKRQWLYEASFAAQRRSEIVELPEDQQLMEDVFDNALQVDHPKGLGHCRYSPISMPDVSTLAGQG